MTHLSNKHLFYLIPIAAGISFLVSLIVFFRPATERYLKYFSVFLLVNCLMETILNLQAMYGHNTVFLNNIETMLVIAFDLFLLRQVIHRRNVKKAFLFVVVAYPIF